MHSINRGVIAALSFVLVPAAAVLVPAAAWAGPCSDDIASLGRQLSQSPAMGPATTGALAGSGPGGVGHAQTAAADTHGTSADGKMGGTAGTKEINAASGNVATSDADVRAQQVGKPTASGQAASGNAVETSPGRHTPDSSASDDRMTRAKAAWQKAVDLNAQNDGGCHGAVDQARQALNRR